MKSQVEYPLTKEAKEIARRLVDVWNRGEIRQHTVSAAFWGEVEFKRDEYSDSGIKVSLDALLELSNYGLIQVNRPYSPDDKDKTIEVLLLQELRNAVENGFIVSDFFLTLNAVGAIVHGNLVMEPGSTFQAAATVGGHTYQTVEQLADSLVSTLGREILDEHADLREAIEELRTASEETRIDKMGKVGMALMRYFSYVGDTAAFINILIFLAQFAHQFR